MYHQLCKMQIVPKLEGLSQSKSNPGSNLTTHRLRQFTRAGVPVPAPVNRYGQSCRILLEFTFQQEWEAFFPCTSGLDYLQCGGRPMESVSSSGNFSLSLLTFFGQEGISLFLGKLLFIISDFFFVRRETDPKTSVMKKRSFPRKRQIPSVQCGGYTACTS